MEGLFRFTYPNANDHKTGARRVMSSGKALTRMSDLAKKSSLFSESPKKSTAAVIAEFAARACIGGALIYDAGDLQTVRERILYLMNQAAIRLRSSVPGPIGSVSPQVPAAARKSPVGRAAGPAGDLPQVFGGKRGVTQRRQPGAIAQEQRGSGPPAEQKLPFPNYAVRERKSNGNQTGRTGGSGEPPATAVQTLEDGGKRIAPRGGERKPRYSWRRPSVIHVRCAGSGGGQGESDLRGNAALRRTGTPGLIHRPAFLTHFTPRASYSLSSVIEKGPGGRTSPRIDAAQNGRPN
ncbi:hypothetical protein SKAU_G00187070 [Synaphobranchus kaupii]|uniref:Uncharacterized protein n=1 Tax=Synaphobranchus kaupii TaxID=118154 RepID=A0A9Q1IWW2_SYNKA|nr:hypothetical protein SKAU_G00187070 [Synaphobranchus kaupii]